MRFLLSLFNTFKREPVPKSPFDIEREAHEAFDAERFEVAHWMYCKAGLEFMRRASEAKPGHKSSLLGHAERCYRKGSFALEYFANEIGNRPDRDARH